MTAPTESPAILRLREALRWALEWIDAVPKDTALPAMPGFDRDYVGDLLAQPSPIYGTQANIKIAGFAYAVPIAVANAITVLEHRTEQLEIAACVPALVPAANLCHDDGGNCGVGGYCATCHQPVSAAPATVDRNAVLVQALEVAEAALSDAENANGFYGTSLATVRAALKSAAPASVPQGPVDDVHWDLFPGFLIDHREGSTITEEGLQFALADMLKDRDYVRVADARAHFLLSLEVAQQVALDAARWREVVRRIGYRETGAVDGPIWTLDLPAPRRSGNTDENFIATIDAARTTKPAEQSAVTQQEKKPLTSCASNRDGDCSHPDCPQLRDNEPHATGRHCPIDTSSEDCQ